MSDSASVWNQTNGHTHKGKKEEKKTEKNQLAYYEASGKGPMAGSVIAGSATKPTHHHHCFSSYLRYQG
jgi:hypothetical protein